ncbi:MAG: FAD-dependent oxidoreductase [Deltaproteobacteria bacterium]|nr:FAD-dependent oxidoreductase [Deltaproteobacteria bacterium]
MNRNKKRILIVGGVAGGASCAARLRRLNEHCEIVIFERGPYVSFANCGLPYYVGNIIKSDDKLLVAKPKRFREYFNIEVRTENGVIGVEREKKEIEVRDLKTGKTYGEHYDALVLSTGASAIRPPLEGIDLPGIFVLRTIPDSREIRSAVENASHAVVVGGGYVGLEMAENLARRGLSVTIVEMLDQVMPPLDPEMATFVANHLRAKGVDLRLGSPVRAFYQRPGGGLVVSTASGDKIDADIVILSIGVRPESSLAKEAGLELGERGGIQVDDRMQTSDPNIWAVGDVVEVRDVVTGTWQPLALAGPANRQGRIAAATINAVLNPDTSGGTALVRFRGVQGTSVCSVFGLSIATTGTSEKALKRTEIDNYEKVYLHPHNHVTYYPGAKEMHIKLLFAKDDGRVLGAQAIGKSDVARRIDVIAMAIQLGGTVYDLEESELCYAPQFGAAKDPVNLAGMVAANYLRGDSPLAQWEQLDGTQAQALDVRTAAEHKKGHIPGAKNIPLNELRGRLGELSKAQEIWTVCQSGHRSYYATRILLQNGFRVKNLPGGMQTYTNLKIEKG